MGVRMSSGSSRQESVRGAWFEARELIWTYRHRLALGLTLMLVNRLAGLVLPASSKYLIDEVIANQRGELLLTIALAIGAAAVVQAVTTFALSQVLGVAAQRAITEMRKRVQRHVTRLPINFFDSPFLSKYFTLQENGLVTSPIIPGIERQPSSSFSFLSESHINSGLAI